MSYAENIALLAETALRFLEIVQLSTTTEATTAGEDQIEAQYKVVSYVMYTGTGTPCSEACREWYNLVYFKIYMFIFDTVCYASLKVFRYSS